MRQSPEILFRTVFPYALPHEVVENRPPLKRTADAVPNPEVAASYWIYTIEENNGRDSSWMAFKLHVSDAFNEQQRTHIYLSTKLLYAYRFPDARQVAAIARNDARDNTTHRFSGRPLHSFPGTTTDSLKEVIRNNGESIGINIALYWELYDWQRPFTYGKVTVDKFEESPTGRTWTLGRATVNYYSDNSQEFRIDLNGLAIGSASTFPFSLDRLTWASVIQHEMLHNLGWRHDGNYDSAWMIAYETVAFPGSQFLLENCPVCNSK